MDELDIKLARYLEIKQFRDAIESDMFEITEYTNNETIKVNQVADDESLVIEEN